MARIGSAQVWVHDQEVALEFYTTKVGMEVQSDVTVPELGNFRWLSVCFPDQRDVSIVLMAIPGPPMFDEAMAAEVRSLLAKGGTSGIFLTTDDCRADHAAMVARGLEFVDPPTEQPYGIDAGFRDPSGNHVRLTQLREL